jgi:hypothetical protein
MAKQKESVIVGEPIKAINGRQPMPKTAGIRIIQVRLSRAENPLILELTLGDLERERDLTLISNAIPCSEFGADLAKFNLDHFHID